MRCPHCNKIIEQRVGCNSAYKIRSDAVRKRMLQLKITQEKLGFLVQRERETVCRIINGKVSLSEKVLYRLADALHLAPEQIADFVGRNANRNNEGGNIDAVKNSCVS